MFTSRGTFDFFTHPRDLDLAFESAQVIKHVHNLVKTLAKRVRILERVLFFK